MKLLTSCIDQPSSTVSPVKNHSLKKHGKTCRSDAELCWGQNDAGLIVKVFCSPEEREERERPLKNLFKSQPSSSLKAKLAHFRYTGTQVMR